MFFVNLIIPRQGAFVLSRKQSIDQWSRMVRDSSRYWRVGKLSYCIKVRRVFNLLLQFGEIWRGKVEAVSAASISSLKHSSGVFTNHISPPHTKLSAHFTRKEPFVITLAILPSRFRFPRSAHQISPPKNAPSFPGAAASPLSHTALPAG